MGIFFDAIGGFSNDRETNVRRTGEKGWGSGTAGRRTAIFQEGLHSDCNSRDDGRKGPVKDLSLKNF